jgi:hypothetical protein
MLGWQRWRLGLLAAEENVDGDSEFTIQTRQTARCPNHSYPSSLSSSLRFNGLGAVLPSRHVSRGGADFQHVSGPPAGDTLLCSIQNFIAR